MFGATLFENQFDFIQACMALSRRSGIFEIVKFLFELPGYGGGMREAWNHKMGVIVELHGLYGVFAFLVPTIKTASFHVKMCARLVGKRVYKRIVDNITIPLIRIELIE